MNNHGLITLEIIGDTERPTYDGDYVVTPKRTEQILATANLLMREDVTVKEIPYAETPTTGTNGNTFIIAS